MDESDFSKHGISAEVLLDDIYEQSGVTKSGKSKNKLSRKRTRSQKQVATIEPHQSQGTNTMTKVDNNLNLKPNLAGNVDTLAHLKADKVDYVSRSAKTFLLYSDSDSLDSIEDPKHQT